MLLMVVYAELFDICRDRQSHVEKREKKRRGKGEQGKSKNRLEEKKTTMTATKHTNKIGERHKQQQNTTTKSGKDNNSKKTQKQNRGKTITATKHKNKIKIKIGERQ